MDVNRFAPIIVVHTLGGVEMKQLRRVAATIGVALLGTAIVVTAAGCASGTRRIQLKRIEWSAELGAPLIVHFDLELCINGDWKLTQTDAVAYVLNQRIGPSPFDIEQGFDELDRYEFFIEAVEDETSITWMLLRIHNRVPSNTETFFIWELIAGLAIRKVRVLPIASEGAVVLLAVKLRDSRGRLAGGMYQFYHRTDCAWVPFEDSFVGLWNE